MPDNALIRVAQLPVIEEHLRALKEQVEAETAEAMSLVCTEETVQTVKETRARLNKKFADLEAQRKPVKAAILAPYEHFLEVYKECVTEPFARADKDLAEKIRDTENEIKARCEVRMREYFAELCAAEGIDWLTFERACVKVDMASAKQKRPKKLMDALKSYVEGVAADIQAIAQMDNAAEIMTEYKAGAPLAAAVSIVNSRHERIKAEETAQEARRAAQERISEAVAKVEAVAPPVVVEAPREAEKPLKCTFTVYATREKLRELKNFLENGGYKYE